MTVSQFDYLVEKIMDEPFERVVNSTQIRLKAAESIVDPIDLLVDAGCAIQPFPGCITDVEEYLQ